MSQRGSNGAFQTRATRGLLILLLALPCAAFSQDQTAQSAVPTKAEFVECFSWMEKGAQGEMVGSMAQRPIGTLTAEANAIGCSIDLQQRIRDPELQQRFKNVMRLYDASVKTPSVIAYTEYITAASRFLQNIH